MSEQPPGLDPWHVPHPADEEAAKQGSFRQPHDAGDPQAASPTSRPRAYTLRLVAAWGTIALCVIVLAVLQFIAMNTQTFEAGGQTGPGFNMLYTGRVSVGMQRVFRTTDPSTIATLEAMVNASPDPATEGLRVAIVLGELDGAEAAHDRLSHAGMEGLLVDSPEIETLALLRAIYSADAYVPRQDETRKLVEQHGWFGEIASTFNLSEQDAAYLTPRRSAESVAWVAFGFMAIVLLGFLLGIILFVTLVVLLAKRVTPIRMPCGPPSHATAYLESVALFLVWFIGLQLIAGVAMLVTPIDLTLLVLVLSPLPLLWPVVCGVRFFDYKQDMGYSAKGLFREIGAGVVGYLAGLPIVAVGIGISFVLGKLIDQTADHPLGDEVVSGRVYNVLVMFFAAVIWAPLVEESVFRAAFYRHLRRVPGVVSWLVATVVTAFVFAAIHPQGIVGVPVLMSIAFVLAMLREWRGSLVPAITAHALHNGTLFMFLLLILHV